MEDKVAGRILLIFVLMITDFPGKTSPEVDAQTITFSGISMTIGNDRSIQERVPDSVITIASVSGSTIAGGPTIAGTGLWDLHVFLTRGTLPDFTTDAKIDGEIVSFNGADTTLRSGDILSLMDVVVSFNLETTTCSGFNLLCANIIRGTNTDFDIAPVNPTCQEIDCRGVVVSQVIPSITNRNQLKQGENNMLEISVALDASPSYGSVFGSDLTQVEVFASLRPDGTGVQFPAIVNSMAATDAARYGISGPGSTIPRIVATLDLTGVGCRQLSYVCVRVLQGPNPMPDYTLSFDPPEANVACKELTCRGLEGVVVQGTFLTNLLGEYKRSHILTIPSITFNSDGEGGSVSSTNQQLWDLEVAVALSATVADIHENTRVRANLQSGQAGQAFIAGGQLQFTDVTAILNLEEYECTRLSHVAVRLLKHPQSPTDFTIASDYSFQAVGCRGLTITSITVSESISTSNNGFPLRERTSDQRMVFDATFGTDHRYGSVRGVNLWQITVGISRVQSPSFATLQSNAVAQLTQAQRNLDVEGGDPLILTGSEVMLTFNEVCANRNYFCVSISKAEERNVLGGLDFQLSGQVVGCAEITCRGVEITQISLASLSPQNIVQHETITFELTAQVLTNPTAGSGSTGSSLVNPWVMRIFFNSNPSLDLSISGDVTGDAASTAFLSGQPTSIMVNSEVTLRGSCEEMQFICLYIEQNVDAQPFFTFVENNNVQFGCTRIGNCIGVVIEQVTVTVDGSDTVIENSGSIQFLSVGLTASRTLSSAMMDPSGSDYWQVMAFGSQSPTGNGERIALEVDVGLSAAQRAVPLGRPSDFGLVLYEILTNDVDCSRLRYVCLELLKNTLQTPIPDFSLAESGIGCAMVTCVGVVVEETTLQIISGGVRERAAENPVVVDLRMTTALVSAGIDGTNLWSLTMFTATQPDGTGLRQITRELPQADWSNSGVINGEAELSGIMLNFDLSTLSCAEIPYVCITVRKSVSPTPEFSLTSVSSSSLTGCALIPCDGLELTATSLTLSQQSDIVIEHSNQPVNVRFNAGFMSDENHETITGSNLWVLDVFLNDREDGTGNQQRSQVTVTDLNGGQHQDISPGGTLQFSDIIASLPVADYVCPTTSYLCVQLQKHPERTFALSVTPPRCVPIECRGVLVTSVSFTALDGDPFVEFAVSHSVLLRMEIQTDREYAGVRGQMLWTYNIFLNPINENSLVRIAESNGLYTLADEIVTAGQPFTSEISSDLTLSQVSCRDANYLCVIVTKGSSPSIEYTFEQTNENILTACQPIRCQGVDLVRVIPNIISGTPFLEQSNQQTATLNIELEFSQNTASVAGMDLWDAEVFLNPNNLGTGTRSATETRMGLDGNVMRGSDTMVDVFSVEFDISNRICSEVQYLCVRIRKHSMAVPNFLLNPEAGRLACVPTNCVGAIIQNLVITPTSPQDLLEVVENRFNYVVSFDANADNAGLSDFNGRDIWSVTLFTNDNSDGSGTRESESIIHQPGSITPGGTLVFGLTFFLDLFNFLCNDGGEDYLCMELGPGQHRASDLSVTYPSPQCMEVMCRGVLFHNQFISIETGTSVMLEYTDNHVVTFGFQVNGDLLSTTVENGTNARQVNVRSLWLVTLTGDNNPSVHTTFSPFYQEATASLTPAQATAPVEAGVIFEMSNVQARMNLTSFYCPSETYHLCIFLDKDPNSFPDFTFENVMRPTGCVEIECRGVLIQTTMVSLETSQFIRERQSDEEVTFDLEVTTDILSSATSGQFLQFRTFISDDPEGNGNENRYGESTLLLSSAQQDMDINPNEAATYESLVATMDLAGLDLCNINGMYFCIEITQNPLSSRPFKLEGNLVGCTEIECRGVRVTLGTASPTVNLPLREGRGIQQSSVQIDASYSAAVDYASIFGQNLWQISVFASNHPNGQGQPVGQPVIGSLGTNGPNLPLIAGRSTVFSVSANLDLGSAYRTCSEIQHVCGTLSRQPAQMFGFEGQPSFATTACARFDCVGVVVTGTDLMVSEGLTVIENNPNFPVAFSVSLNFDFTSSTLAPGGSNRWRIEIFGNSRADGLGERISPREAVLQDMHLTLGAQPGVATQFNNIMANLDLSNQYCSTLQFLCVEVSRPMGAVPPFRLTGLNGEPERLIGCQLTDCIGVRITGGTLTVPETTRLTEGLTMDTLERIDVTYQSHVSGAGASGVDLWTLEVFLATSSEGLNPSSRVVASLAGTAGSQPLIAGGQLNFHGTSAVLDTTNLQCSNFPHICVTLGGNPNRRFSLNGYNPTTDTFNDNILTMCSPITCDGVVIANNDVAVIQPTTSIFAREDNFFCFDVVLTFANDGGSVVGSNLWDITAFMSENENGDPVVESSEVTVTLTDDQRALSAIPGNTAAFDNLKANLSLANLNCPSGVAYLCVRINSNEESIPSFSVSGRVVGCAPVQCTGLMIESSSVLLVDPDNIRENTIDQSVTVDITLTLAENSADFELDENLWQSVRIYTADAEGNQRGSANTVALLTTEQSRTSLRRGQAAIIRGVFFTNFNTMRSQCQAIPYFCVTLENNPRFSVQFLDNSQTACARLPCRGVEILEVILEGDGPSITERSPSYNLVLNVLVESDIGGAGISGTSLWTLYAFFDTQQDCRGNAFPGTRTQNLEISNRALERGQTLSLRSSAFRNMNLLNLLCPDGPLYLCVEFDKLPSANPPFTLTFVPDESTKYASVEATCQGVEVVVSTLSINSGQEVTEGDRSHDFDLNFFSNFAITSASVQGTNLWELVIYGSRDANGRSSQEFLTTIPLNIPSLRNQPAVPAGRLFFTHQPVTVNLRGVRCANYPYVCVKLIRNLASSPVFTFSGDEDNRIACETVTCAGIHIDTFVAGISTGTVIYENTLDQEIRTSLTIQSSPQADPAVGNNYWRPFIFFNDNIDGNGPAGRISLTEMTIEDDNRGNDLPPGSAVIFHPATATVDFTTSCAIGNYMCFEIFNGMDLMRPTYTLLGNVVHCLDIDCVGFIVADTSLQIQVGSTLSEGASSHSVTFVVSVTSSPTGVGATLSPMWEVRAFLANRDNSDGIVEGTVVAEATVENVLSETQRVMPISEGATANFNGVQASFVIEGLVCEDTQYLCVEFNAVEGSDHSATPLNGEIGRLFDCAPLSCTGIEVVSSGLQLFNGEPLISNEISQELILNFEFITSANSIAIEGQRLFRIRIFPNNATDGTGVTPLDTNVELALNQFTSIQPGSPNNFENLFVTMSLQGVRCDQMPYICGTLLKGTSPSPDYTLQPEPGSPVLTACTRMLACVGIQITEFDVTVSSGIPIPEDATSHRIVSMITVSSSPDGGSVTGLNLWRVTVFMSSTPNGQSERFFAAEADIGEEESAALMAGGTIEMNPVVFLALNGFSCAATRYLCHEFAKSDAASVDFTLEAASTLPDGLINCQEFLCRGVTFDAVSFSINSNQGDDGFRVFELDRNFQVSLNIDVEVGIDSVSVTGTDLWEVTVFLSDASDGTGPRLGENLAALTSEQGETSIEGAETARLTNVLASLNLTDIKCDQFQYLCIEVWNGDNAVPRYRIDEPASREDLRQCLPVSCAGVEILSVEIVFGERLPVLLDRTSLPQTVTFDLEVAANPFGAGVEGTNLWQVEAYIWNQDDIGSPSHQPPASSLVTATLPQSEENKALQTSETLILEQVAVDLELPSRTCNDIAFLCATLQKGPSANPDFDIQPSGPASSLTDCAPVECVDAAITETTMVYGPPSTLERDPAHTITMNITAQTSEFGRVITADGLWTFMVFGSNGNPGNINSPVVSLSTELTLAQRNVDFFPDSELVFRNVEATLDLQTLSCEELTHFCVQIGFVERFELRGVPDESSLIACSPVDDCGEFEVNLRVTSFDENSIGIAWSGGIGDFDFYEISYEGLRTPFSFPRFGNTRTLLLGQLTSGQEYVITIRLKKQNEFQEGSETVTQRTLPERVAEVEVSDINSQSIEVTWTPVGGVFDSYVVRIQPGGGSPSSPHTVGPTVTSLVFTNLVIATAYSVTVVSRSEDLESIPTEATGFTTPTMPMLRVVEFTATTVYVEWTAPAGYTPNRYRLSYSSTPTNLRTEVIGAGEREFTLTNLIPTTQYDIGLVAEVEDSSTGTVASSESSNAIVSTGPDKPEVVITSDINSITITLSLNRGTAELYRIDYRPTFSPTISRLEVRNVTRAPVTVPITNLPSATTYFIDVVSIYKEVASDLCRITQSTRVESASSLVIGSVTSSSITFSWQGPDSIQLDDYRINITYGTIVRTNNTLSTTYTADNLPAYTNIMISVEVRFIGEGTNIYSLPITIRQRTSSKPPGPVRGAEITQIGTEQRILLTFEIPEMPNGELEAFITTNTKFLNDVVQSVTTSTITVESQEDIFYSQSFSNNVIRGCSYMFTVTARNQEFDGETVTTNTILITQTPPNIVLRQPLRSSNVELSERTLLLEFDTSSISPPGTGNIQNYTIIVAELGQPVEGDPINEPLPNYDQQPEGPYQPFRERDWPDDGIITVELGTDRICGSFMYCNGPLKPGTTYLVAIRVYNERGYDTSDFEEFTTAQAPTPSPSPTPSPTLTFIQENRITLIIAGSAVGIVLLISAIIIIVLCVYCCCSCRDNENHHRSSKGRRGRYDSDSESESSGDGLDNLNLNNATVLVYNPEDRNSSAASMASRLDGGVITRPVPINEFAAHVGRLGANNQEGFEVEFESLRDFGLDQSTSVAVTKENKAKNRFSNILPYNNSRVVLHGDEDYINASFITGSNRLHEFIATQGPMEHTVNDFWRMIWEQQVPIIVMICDIVEGGKTKCEEYWPPLGEPTACGEIRVTMLSEKQTTKGKEREFKLEIGEHSRTVSHFQFLEWPDKGVPSDTQFFTLFVKDIRSRMKTLSGPVVIHCSDGASRTGVFIALDSLMQGLANQADTLDVYGVVGRLRQERVNMVLSKNYYVFLHQAILDILLAQVSDSNWSYGPSTSHRYEYAPLEDSDLLGAESTL